MILLVTCAIIFGILQSKVPLGRTLDILGISTVPTTVVRTMKNSTSQYVCQRTNCSTYSTSNTCLGVNDSYGNAVCEWSLFSMFGTPRCRTNRSQYRTSTTPHGKLNLQIVKSYKEDQKKVAYYNCKKLRISPTPTSTPYSPTATPTPTPRAQMTPTATPSPDQPPVTQGNCTRNVWGSLESCGWPGVSNTGPSGNLTTMSSGMTINTPGVYTNLDIKGYLNINASNVTVRNFKLSSINYGYTALRIDPSATNVVLEDCEVNPNFVTQFAIWGYDNITIRRCELQRAGNAIQARQNLVFQDNYCHDIDDVANDGDNWHTNCVIAVNDSRGVSGWNISHNTMRLGTPGGLKYYSGVINTLLASNNLIENNLIANGSFTMYLFDSRSATVTPSYTYVRNNRFSTVDYPTIGVYGLWYKGQGWDQYKGSVDFSGNTVLETGASVNAVEP